MGESRDDEREKYDQYPNTILEFLGPPVERVDLRVPLTTATRELVKRVGPGERFAVLTAENPCGENVEDAATARQADAREERNERRTGRLEDELDRRGVPYSAVDGVSPDGSYRERCLAIALPRGEAVELARRLEQLALFWYDGSAFWLLPAEVDQEPIRLPPVSGNSN